MVGEDSPTLGVVGAGQLGRMIAEAAAPLGVEIILLDPTPDPPAAQVATDILEGDFDDASALRSLADRVDFLTVEIELADPDILEAIHDDTGVPVHPSPSALRITRDKLTEKRMLDDADIPIPAYTAVSSVSDLANAAETLGLPIMLKARTGGYDGRGNFLIESTDDVHRAYEVLSGPLIAEEAIDFDRELSVIGAKNDHDIRTFSVSENVHHNEILHESIVPARTTSAVIDRARTVVHDVLSLLNGRGVFGIELFETDGSILVNEIAPRPHNSGHYTIEGSVTSQFEQHIRAVLDLPLGDTTLRNPTAMANILGDDAPSRPAVLRGIHHILETPGASLHWYGKKEVRPHRKMGHVTVIPTASEGPSELLTTARTITRKTTFKPGS